jgi:hypothetical protein
MYYTCKTVNSKYILTTDEYVQSIYVTHTAKTATNDRPVLSSKRAPHIDKPVTVQQYLKPGQWAPDGARHQDGLTDWLTVGRNVTLTPNHFYTEDGSSMPLPNVGIHLQDNTVWQPRCPQSELSLPWKRKNLGPLGLSASAIMAIWQAVSVLLISLTTTNLCL